MTKVNDNAGIINARIFQDPETSLSKGGLSESGALEITTLI